MLKPEKIDGESSKLASGGVSDKMKNVIEREIELNRPRQTKCNICGNQYNAASMDLGICPSCMSKQPMLLKDTDSRNVSGGAKLSNVCRCVSCGKEYRLILPNDPSRPSGYGSPRILTPQQIKEELDEKECLRRQYCPECRKKLDEGAAL